MRPSLACPACGAPAETPKLSINGYRSNREMQCGCGWEGYEDDLKVKFDLRVFTGQLEEEVTLAQFRELLAQYERSVYEMYYPLNAVPTIVRSQGTFTNAVAQGKLESEQTVAAANRSNEFSILGVTNDAPWELRHQGAPGKHFRFGAFVGAYGPTNSTATTYAGIQIGSYESLPPYSSTPTSAVCQLRYLYSTQRIELQSAVGDGSDESVQSFDLGTISPHGLFMELEYEQTSDAPVEGTIKAYIDGVHIGTTIAGKFPDLGGYGSANDSYLSLFQTSGTNAGALAHTFFSGVHYVAYDVFSA